MFKFRLLSAVISILCLTSCFKITGEAQDPFDIAHGEQAFKLNQVGRIFKRNSEEDVEVASVSDDSLSNGLSNDVRNDLSNSLEGTTESTTNELGPVPDTTSSDVSQSGANADFEKWKSERDSESDEYQQFKEYLEYKEWLEYKKAQDQ